MRIRIHDPVQVLAQKIRTLLTVLPVFHPRQSGLLGGGGEDLQDLDPFTHRPIHRPPQAARHAPLGPVQQRGGGAEAHGHRAGAAGALPVAVRGTRVGEAIAEGEELGSGGERKDPGDGTRGG